MSFSAFDHHCMALALRQAARGLFTTHPNPRVGCVIARDGQVIASAWHVRAGEPHAEIHALAQAGASARGATAYVTLEPCSHHGRTPPCSDALIAAGVRRVVIALQDPNIQVNGTGHRHLERSGLQVEVGLMAAEAAELNAGFLLRMSAGRPWVRVKLATSLDGRTALQNGVSHWISNAAARQDVQYWRARSAAILTGIGTVLADDPAMTARVTDPPLTPLRVIADSHWRTPPASRILADPGSALIIGAAASAIPRPLRDTGVACQPLGVRGGGVDLDDLMRHLAAREINEVQVEAGPRLCGGLLRAGLVDELLLYQAPLLLGDGAAGPFALGPLESMRQSTHFELLESCALGDNLRLRLRPRSATRQRAAAGH